MAPCSEVGSGTVSEAAPCIVPYVCSISSQEGMEELGARLSSAAYASVEYASDVTIVLRIAFEVVSIEKPCLICECTDLPIEI